MRVLIVYGTSEGQTRKVAGFLANRFNDQAAAVALVDARHPPADFDPAEFDAVVVAARVHSGRYPAPIRRFIRRNRHVLTTKLSAFLSVSLTAAIGTDKARAAVAGYVERLAHSTGWQPARILHVGGARFYTKHGAFGRWLLGRIDSKAWGKPIDTSRDMEWTDWQAVGHFGDEFLAGSRPNPEHSVTEAVAA